MPRWVASVPRSTSLLNGPFLKRLTCASRPRVIRTPPYKYTHTHLCARAASTHVSPLTINLNPEIPRQNVELHRALEKLGDKAGSYVNGSRLQLALRGLAEKDAVTRVAVLGLNSQLSAQRLARLLLADPLGVEEGWEKELEKMGDGEQGALLLKYGDESDAQAPSPLYKTLSIPSRVLRAHNLEILVSTLNVNLPSTVPEISDNSTESILVPKLQTASARALPVPFPVHKTLILGDGIDSAIAFGRFSSDTAEDLGELVKVAIDIPAPAEGVDPNAQTGSTAIDLRVGAEAVATFRQSIQNAIAYERGWYRSGLPALSKWLVPDTQVSTSTKPAVTSLVASIVEDVENSITRKDAARLQQLASVPQQSDASASATHHLETWAEKSHAELRDQLDAAFSARNWHKLAWWKLFWRVDDVTMIATETIERSWLVSAEKESIYLAGQMNQAGFPDEIPASVVAANIPEGEANSTPSASEIPSMHLSTTLRPSAPWLSLISTARQDLLANTIPPLQALAQRLLLQTFSTTSIASALSALLFVAAPSVSAFEASAVAALGLTFSLRKMQKLWEGARESVQGSVREEGRRTLKGTEEVVRLIIKGREVESRGMVGEEKSVVERREAREACEEVREVLEKIK